VKRRRWSRIAALLAFCCLCVSVFAVNVLAGKKKKDEITQTLAAPPEPPAAVAANTRRLVFHTSPLSGRGLLSQQTKDALHDLLRQNEGMQIVKIRAFVVGAGDLRRIPQLVGEILGEKKHQQLPAVSVVLGGGLPVEGAQVALESISEAKRDVNPNGLLFTGLRKREAERPGQRLSELADQSIADIAAAVAGHGEVLEVTCFLTRLEEASRVTNIIADRFPGATSSVVQAQRAASPQSVACEAIARAGAVAGNAPGVVALNAGRAVFTGTQVAYGFNDDDARLAFKRLDHVLEGFGTNLKKAAEIDVYPLSPSIAAQTRKVEPEFVDPSLTAVLEIPFESVPGLDASFAVEAVAPVTP
jgi:enamine deaminase RidA (YjgF/YER057c/UK114 family)